MLAATVPAERANGQAVNVGAGGRTSLLELLDLMRQASGRAIAVQHLPPRAGDVRDSLADLRRATEVIGYVPKVGLRDGLERTWTWMASLPAAAASA